MSVRGMLSVAAFMAVFSYGVPLATAAAPIINQDRPAAIAPAGLIQNSTLMGATVVNPQGQKLGLINDVLLDSQTGQATFVVLDAEVPQSGHAMLVVPYRALWVSFNPIDHRQSVVLDLRPDQLHSAPQIQNSNWQVLQNPLFLAEARTFYHISQPVPYTAARPIENENMAALVAATTLYHAPAER